MTCTVTIHPSGTEIKARKNDLLADRLAEAGIPLSVYCNKRGLCGKCFVEIQKGSLPKLDKKEKFLLQHKRLRESHRLSCLYRIQGDLVISIPESSLIPKASILKTGISVPVDLDPFVKKYHFSIEKPALHTPSSPVEKLGHSLQNTRLSMPLNLLKTLPNTLQQGRYDITALLFDDREVLHIEPGDTSDKIYGIAVDIGTTTVVVELIHLGTGQSIDTAAEWNGQVKYGSDVISRIGFSLENEENLKVLQDAICQTLNQMVARLLKKNRIQSSHVYEAVIAGNTPMNHFLLGVSTDTLSRVPFQPVFTILPELLAQEIGLRLNRNAKAYVVPNIQSFVGGDISSGLIASRFESQKGNHLFVDLGTNGEVVLKTDGAMVATSTAAGPAFEGMNIACGMLAVPGAISSAENKNGMILSTIGNRKPLGICGTGLIDLIAIFLDRGLILPNGSIKTRKRKISVTEQIVLEQNDIREVQLAVSAVKTGTQLLLEEFHLANDDLDGIWVAGAFGNSLNIQNSMKLGLLPLVKKEKVTFIGNSSLAGAKALLLSRSARRNVEFLIKKIQYVSLASKSSFQKAFIENLEFKNSRANKDFS